MHITHMDMHMCVICTCLYMFYDNFAFFRFCLVTAISLTQKMHCFTISIVRTEMSNTHSVIHEATLVHMDDVSAYSIEEVLRMGHQH